MTKPLAGVSVNGPVTAVNGVVFAGSMDAMGTMFAFDAATGDVLWSFQSGGTVYGGPAVASGGHQPGIRQTAAATAPWR